MRNRTTGSRNTCRPRYLRSSSFGYLAIRPITPVRLWRWRYDAIIAAIPLFAVGYCRSMNPPRCAPLTGRGVGPAYRSPQEAAPQCGTTTSSAELKELMAGLIGPGAEGGAHVVVSAGEEAKSSARVVPEQPTAPAWRRAGLWLPLRPVKPCRQCELTLGPQKVRVMLQLLIWIAALGRSVRLPCPGLSVLVRIGLIGYADCPGEKRGDFLLSQRRADNVRPALDPLSSSTAAFSAGASAGGAAPPGSCSGVGRTVMGGSAPGGCRLARRSHAEVKGRGSLLCDSRPGVSLAGVQRRSAPARGSRTTVGSAGWQEAAVIGSARTPVLLSGPPGTVNCLTGIDITVVCGPGDAVPA